MTSWFPAFPARSVKSTLNDRTPSLSLVLAVRIPAQLFPLVLVEVASREAIIIIGVRNFSPAQTVTVRVFPGFANVDEALFDENVTPHVSGEETSPVIVEVLVTLRFSTKLPVLSMIVEDAGRTRMVVPFVRYEVSIASLRVIVSDEVVPVVGLNCAFVSTSGVVVGLLMVSNSFVDHIPSTGATGVSKVKTIVSPAAWMVVPTIPVSGSVGGSALADEKEKKEKKVTATIFVDNLISM